nr:ankyrin repeat domain-containing protein [Bacteroidota bacterium]
MKQLFLLLMILSYFCSPLFSQTIQQVILEGDLQELKSMVKQNPDLLGFTNDNENSCIHFAARAGKIDMVEYLIEKGANINAVNIASETPLHFATAFGHKDVMETLIRNGAFVNIPNRDGNTPLHYAVNFSTLEIVQYLLDNGTDVNFQDILDFTALDYAQAAKKEDMVKLIAARGGRETRVGDPKIVQVTHNINRITFPYCERPNIALMKGKEGLLIVDTGCDEKIIEKLDLTLEAFDRGALRLIINTHLHRDHIAGNGIGGNTVPIINYTNLKQMAKEGIINPDKQNDASNIGKAFDTIYTLQFNDEKILLIPYPGIHTMEDLMVYFSGAGVVHTGDLFISQSFPSVFYNVTGYLDLLQKMISVFPESTVFIGGHGVEGSKEDLISYHTMLAGIYEVIIQQLKEGKSIKEIRDSDKLQGYESWAEFIPQLSIYAWIDAVTRNYQSKKPF